MKFVLHVINLAISCLLLISPLICGKMRFKQIPLDGNFKNPINIPSSKEMYLQLMKDPKTRTILQEIEKNPQRKIIFPNEIHSKFVDKGNGNITVTIGDNPWNKKNIENLLDKETYQEMIDQNENNEVDDPTGLFNVLKKIQNKKCKCDFLCIEIGTIYGPFDDLNPQNVTILTNFTDEVDLIIKPIVIINSTVTEDIIPPTPLIDHDNQTEPIIPSKIIADQDCDELSLSGNSFSGSNLRFKQLPSQTVKKLQRKFYRKVEFENEILANDIFKQGLNVIILKREKKYTKIYERTFNTNVDQFESDAMACVLQGAGYDKIVIITGIGKWMGAITPRLVLEVMQIGGPDLNTLVSIDSEDNSMMDHSFVLVGRKGLCKYNGVFRVKNYDISKELKKYFPNISSDPNDCLFENLTFENEMNKRTEHQFFHIVDLRLMLNILNDGRFSILVPVITSVSPPTGPLIGGNLIRIRGIGFGKNPLNIKEVLVVGVRCIEICLVNENLITCKTGSRVKKGPEVGNVVVRYMSGLSTPEQTCPFYGYSLKVEPKEIIPALPIINHRTIRVRVRPRPIPVPVPVPVVAHHMYHRIPYVPLVPVPGHPIPIIHHGPMMHFFAFKSKDEK